MKKLAIVIAVMAVAFCVSAQTQAAKTQYTKVAAAGTVFTNDFSYGDTFKYVEKIGFINQTTNAATTVAYTYDGGVLTQIGTSGSVAAGATAEITPTRSVVPYPGVTNLVPYAASRLKFITTMGAANGVAVSQGIGVTVLAK